ncbi:hypothetical protein [Streptomyces sp. NRRL F-2747]|uniref:hypothetical protein n=1 Tax=Streptomyces sp. NRRL F-2747 TaxID=1463843 RepID=UPI000AA079C4|nr:hypothetical protein [Streptomyces sp. NRRL F-2747]
MPWITPRPTAALSAVALAACGLLLAGCSSGAGAARTAAGASASASPSADAKAMDAYRQCLAQHGVTMAPRPTGSRGPGGGGGGGGGGWGGASGGPGRRASADPQRNEATQACADLRPQFNGRGGGPGGGDGGAMKAFTSCLKDHGVVLPSASPDAPGTRGFPTTDPQSAQAFETCKALLPQRGRNTPQPGASPSASAL